MFPIPLIGLIFACGLLFLFLGFYKLREPRSSCSTCIYIGRMIGLASPSDL
uniref:Uncharacterized protein n=1 Tax=Arundo donax TaxID=35708 RepID=A0A0A9B6Z4_ARUDO